MHSDFRYVKVWTQHMCGANRNVCVEWACVFGLLAVNTYSNWFVSLSTSHSKPILYSAFSTFSLFHSKIDGFLHSHKTKFKPDANLFFYFPTTRFSTIYAIIPCPYLSTPTPPFIFNLQKSSPKIFTSFGISLLHFSILLSTAIYCQLIFLTVYLLARSISFLKNIYETTIMIVLNSYNQTNVLLTVPDDYISKIVNNPC